MTTAQILELAKEYLEEWEADEDGRTWVEFSTLEKWSEEMKGTISTSLNE